VLASDRGGLPELVGDRAVVDPDDRDAWAEALGAIWSMPARERDELGDQLLSRARGELGEERYYAGLMAVYGEAASADP
jgi:glycosyltransferase involved in cell wall biosynthesis